MYTIYKSVDDFTNVVLFTLSKTFFGDIYKFANGFRNTKNINKNNYKYEEYDYKNIWNINWLPKKYTYITLLYIKNVRKESMYNTKS